MFVNSACSSITVVKHSHVGIAGRHGSTVILCAVAFLAEPQKPSSRGAWLLADSAHPESSREPVQHSCIHHAANMHHIPCIVCNTQHAYISIAATCNRYATFFWSSTCLEQNAHSPSTGGLVPHPPAGHATGQETYATYRSRLTQHGHLRQWFILAEMTRCLRAERQHTPRGDCLHFLHYPPRPPCQHWSVSRQHEDSAALC